NGCKDGQGVADNGDVAGVVAVADRQSDGLEPGQQVAVFEYVKPGQSHRQNGLWEAVAAVLSDHQAPAEGVQCADGICFGECKAAGAEREREHERITRRLSGVDQAVSGVQRLLGGTGGRECENQTYPKEDVGVTAAACKPGAEELNAPLGLSAG